MHDEITLVSFATSYLRLKTELVPVSVSFTSMFRLASGVPKGTFSGIVTLRKDKQKF